MNENLDPSIVLVTGGAGYIGSNLVHRLTKNGKRVAVLDNMSSGSADNLPKMVKLYEGDLGDSQLLNKIFLENSVDAVFHFAAKKSVAESTLYPDLYLNENVSKTKTLLEVMHTHNCTKLIFASTAAVYGDRQVSEQGYSETDLPNPTNPYGQSKLQAEQIILEATKNSKLKVLIFRFFNVALSESLMNPYNGEDLLSILTQNYDNSEKFLIFGDDYFTPDGTCYRDFIHISDLLDALEKSLPFLGTNSSCFTVLNLGSGRGISLGEIAKIGHQILGEKFIFEYSARRLGDIAFSLSDISSSKDFLGWQPKVDPQIIFSSFFEDLKRKG